SYDMIFSDTSDFSHVLQTMSFTASDNGNQVNSELFDSVVARYVRMQATSFTGAPNTGVSDIQFFTPVPEPAVVSLAGLAGLALVRRRRACVRARDGRGYRRNGMKRRSFFRAFTLVELLVVIGFIAFRIP